MKTAFATSLLLASVAGLLAGCQSNPTQPSKPQIAQNTLAAAEKILREAALLQGAAQQKQQLNAAKMLLDLNYPERALTITQALNPQILGDALYVKQRDIQSRALLKTGNIHAAKGQLEAPRLSTLLNKALAQAAPTQRPSNPLSLNTLAALRETRATIYYDLAEPLLAIRERILLGQILNNLNIQQAPTPLALSNMPTIQTEPASQPASKASAANTLTSDIQINQELIWMMLMEQDIDWLKSTLNALNATELHNTPLKNLSADAQEQGWYQLAIVSKNNQRNINQQYSALLMWQQQWPKHAANNPLPADLALIQNLVNNQPQRIALLLPLSGRLKPIAQAVRDGFMAAYFANSEAGGQTPDINIYDVSQGDINTHYDLAVSQGAQVIIGPLSKKAISELALRPTLAVPTLALNQIEPSGSYPAELFQLGLGIEDEAAQAAQKAFKDGHRHALIIAPAGNQGDRASQVFNQQWQALGGTVGNAVRYSNERELSNIIEQAMHLNGSKNRARALRKIVGSFEFEPRRRQDIDMIFMVAQPRQGRQIKPLLAFHYAGDLPIYSTSSIFAGEMNKRENDLNGIMFSHLPWFFQNTPEKSNILKNTTLNARSQRLYALGVDAYYLFPRLTQLGSARQANFWGQTGVLSLNNYRQFIRKQQWAVFKKGRVQSLMQQ